MASPFVSAVASLATVATLAACNETRCEPITIRPGLAIGSARLGATSGDVEAWLGPPQVRSSIADAPRNAFTGQISEAEAAVTEMLLFSEPCFTLLVIARRDTVVTAQIAGVRDPSTIVTADLPGIHPGQFYTEAQFTPLQHPSTRTRHPETEAQMRREGAVQGDVEYYSYVFDNVGLVVGVVFDHARRESGEPWIGVQSVSVVQRRR